MLNILLIDWREDGEYYCVLYPKERSNPYAELWNVDRSSTGTTLSWTYKPTKRDGRNPERSEYFRRYVGATTMGIGLPSAPDSVPQFLKDLFDLVDARLRADRLDDERPNPRIEFPEGAVVERLHKARERNSALIELVKQDAQRRFGCLRCAVCAFDFSIAYGTTGEGYIEAHHTTPLPELTSEARTRPENIVLVCSNCHRMLHRRRPWLGARELQTVLAESRR